jgi:hypothetical protein
MHDPNGTAGYGDDHDANMKYDLKDLKVILTAGEPCNQIIRFLMKSSEYAFEKVMTN